MIFEKVYDVRRTTDDGRRRKTDDDDGSQVMAIAHMTLWVRWAKKAIRSSISMPIPKHYSYGPRKLNIILTHLRWNTSFLNYDWCKDKILSNYSCNCGAPCEISHHFFFDCDKYIDNREILFDSLNWLPSNINIDVKLLTKGSDFLAYQDNTTIFRHAFKYIKDSKRFTNCLNDLKNQHTFLKVFILLSFLSYIVST
jgi:hypothetical protein